MNKEVSGISRAWFDIVSKGNKSEEMFRQLMDMLGPGDLCYVNNTSVHSGEAVTVVRIEDVNAVAPVLAWVPSTGGDMWFTPYELLKVELDVQKPRCYASVRTHLKTSKDPQFIWNQIIAPIITTHYVPTIKMVVAKTRLPKELIEP